MPETEKKDTILWVNTLKGFCILLVVLHHSVITTLIPSIEHLSSGGVIAKLWGAFNYTISPLRMPAFFFISGLLASNSVINKKWNEVLTKKVSNLIYLYILWCFIQWLFIKKIISEPAGMQLSDSSNSAYAETISDFTSLVFTAASSLWYLYALAGYFAISKIFSKYKEILLVSAIALNYISGFGYISGWGASSIAQNMIFFVVGVYFFEFFVGLSFFSKRNAIAWVAILALAIINIKIGITKNIFTCFFAIIFSIMICRYLNSKFNMSLLNWIGKNTLQIYVIHRIFIEAFGVALLYIGVNYGLFNISAYSIAWAVTYPLVSVVLCTTLSLAVWYLINKKLGRVLFSHPKLVYKKII